MGNETGRDLVGGPAAGSGARSVLHSGLCPCLRRNRDRTWSTMPLLSSVVSNINRLMNLTVSHHLVIISVVVVIYMHSVRDSFLFLFNFSLPFKPFKQALSSSSISNQFRHSALPRSFILHPLVEYWTEIEREKEGEKKPCTNMEWSLFV